MRATGEQFELSRSQDGGQSRAIITELAAALRVLVVDGDALTETYPDTTLPPFGNGIVLSPWPNRIRDGRWMLGGSPQQLALTEPDRRNAIHGLLRSTPYRVTEREGHAITLAATIYPQKGYPFVVDTSVRYELVGDGITVTHRFWNRSDAAAPVAVGAHPFLRVGDAPIEELTLTVDASTLFEVDERMNPTREVPVDDTDYDLRAGRLVGELELDVAFGAVSTDDDAIAHHRLTAPDGRYTELWQGPEFGWVQAFTTRDYPRPDGAGVAVAIEPMSAPPDAFNSGDGVRWLEPDESWEAMWGIRRGVRS